MLYLKCAKNLMDVCITSNASVDNTEWVSSTSYLTISDGKLPVCYKANKNEWMIFFFFPNFFLVSTLQYWSVSKTNLNLYYLSPSSFAQSMKKKKFEYLTTLRNVHYHTMRNKFEANVWWVTNENKQKR